MYIKSFKYNVEKDVFMLSLAFIGGTGLENLLNNGIRKKIKTPFGDVNVTLGKINNHDIIFIPRHGYNHETPPHLVNYKSIIYSIRKLGVKKIVATGSVGSLNPSCKPGDLVLIDQFLDFTKNRQYSFYDEVYHTDMTEPFCIQIREKILNTGSKLGLNIIQNGTYACFEGPRFETKAEINAIKILGADLVGMTLSPEVVLAKELGICYASISVVTNWAAGIQDKITVDEVHKTMSTMIDDLRNLFTESTPSIYNIIRDKNCMDMEKQAELFCKKTESKSLGLI